MNELLIEPYGIEITSLFQNKPKSMSLLIEPYGIEIGSNKDCASVNVPLLIEPYGIEITIETANGKAIPDF